VSKTDAQARQIDQQLTLNHSLEVKVQQLTDQLLQQQLNTRSAFDQRLDRELSALREASQRDLQQVREASQEMATREARLLREARAQLEAECEGYRRRLEQQAGELATVSSELQLARATRDSDVSRARADLQIKTFECTSVGSALEEKAAQCRSLALQVDAHQQEIGALRAALFRLEGEYEARCLALREELGRAVSGSVADKALGGSSGRVLLSTGDSSTSSSSSDAAALNEQQQRRVDKLSADNRQLQRELEVLRQTSAPGGRYSADRIRSLEGQLAEAVARLTEAERRTEEAVEAAAAAEEDCAELQLR
jgi:hypothetical protein